MNTEHLPIIFFHKGYDPYIAFALWQARVTNPQSPIYLLGDESNDLSFLGISHVPFERYPGRRDEFIALYRHFSTHELEWERLCFERHFHLADFVKREGIGPFLYLDSDVLLMMNAAQFLPFWRERDAGGIPGLYGSCYYVSASVADNFCSFMIDRYRDGQQIEAWRKAYEQQAPGATSANISDMVLSHMFLERAGLRVLDLREPRDGIAFNTSFLASQTEPVSVAWTSDGNGVCSTVNGQLVRWASLHFLGWSKRYASAFVPWSWPLVRCFLRPNYRRNFKKLVQHAYYGRRFKRSITRSAGGSLANTVTVAGATESPKPQARTAAPLSQ
jgi:hypothetical protein